MNSFGNFHFLELHERQLHEQVLNQKLSDCEHERQAMVCILFLNESQKVMIHNQGGKKNMLYLWDSIHYACRTLLILLCPWQTGQMVCIKIFILERHGRFSLLAHCGINLSTKSCMNGNWARVSGVEWRQMSEFIALMSSVYRLMMPYSTLVNAKRNPLSTSGLIGVLDPFT